MNAFKNNALMLLTALSLSSIQLAHAAGHDTHAGHSGHDHTRPDSHAPIGVMGDHLMREDEIMLITNGGILVRTKVGDVSVVGRNTQGVRLIKLGKGENLTQLVQVASMGDDEDAEDTDAEESIVEENVVEGNDASDGDDNIVSEEDSGDES